MKTHKGSRGIILLIHNLEARWGCVMKAKCRPLYPPANSPPNFTWGCGLVLKGVKKIKFLACMGVRTQSCHVVESRYTQHVIPAPVNSTTHYTGTVYSKLRNIQHRNSSEKRTDRQYRNYFSHKKQVKRKFCSNQ